MPADKIRQDVYARRQDVTQRRQSTQLLPHQSKFLDNFRRLRYTHIINFLRSVMMKKIPFVTKEQVEKITEQYPTPFHIYDEKGIRENARLLKKAFSWNKGFKEYFAVKATPNPHILNILRQEGAGADCSSLTELMMSDNVGFKGNEIMFSSNVTPKEDFRLAAKLGAIVNFDDLTHIDYYKEIAPLTLACAS